MQLLKRDAPMLPFFLLEFNFVPSSGDGLKTFRADRFDD